MFEGKIVYDPTEHAKIQKNVTMEQTKKAVVYPQPAKKLAKAAKSTEPTKPNTKNAEPEETVTEFKAKMNKYGFIHVPKRAWTSLPFGPEKPLVARIAGDKLIIEATR